MTKSFLHHGFSMMLSQKTPIFLSTLFLLCGSLSADVVVQEWNFNDTSDGTASLISDQGLNSQFFGTIGDNILNDGAYNVTRGNGFSGDRPLGSTFNASNTRSMTVAVTLSDFDFSNGDDQSFAVRLRNDSSNTIFANLNLDAQPASTNPARMRLTGTAVAGVIQNGTSSSSPITYGMTIDFEANSYTYWVGTPTSDGSTWENRFNNYTGSLDLSTAEIDGVQWGISNHGDGDSFNLDQVSIRFTAVPEPAAGGFLGTVFLGMILRRRR
jgi:hypothetical protein